MSQLPPIPKSSTSSWEYSPALEATSTSSGTTSTSSLLFTLILEQTKKKTLFTYLGHQNEHKGKLFPTLYYVLNWWEKYEKWYFTCKVTTSIICFITFQRTQSCEKGTDWKHPCWPSEYRGCESWVMPVSDTYIFHSSTPLPSTSWMWESDIDVYGLA